MAISFIILDLPQNKVDTEPKESTVKLKLGTGLINFIAVYSSTVTVAQCAVLYGICTEYPALYYRIQVQHTFCWFRLLSRRVRKLLCCVCEYTVLY